MPRKLAINLEYLRTRTLASDIRVIFSTLLAVVRPRT
jgi:lipopolysaccharide/colanic/teichoic acid biosynthesis glycosyltransferase